MLILLIHSSIWMCAPAFICCISYASGYTEVCHKGLPPFLHPTPYTSTCLRIAIVQICMNLKHTSGYSDMRKCKEVCSHILNTVSFATVLSMTVRHWENGQRDEVGEIGDSNRMFLEKDILTRWIAETELHFSAEGSCPFTSCSYTMSLSLKESKITIFPLNHTPCIIFNLPYKWHLSFFNPDAQLFR